METYAVLDDGSERTIVLPTVVQHLKLTGSPELLPLQTVQQCHAELDRISISVLSIQAHDEVFCTQPIHCNWFMSSGAQLPSDCPSECLLTSEGSAVASCGQS